MELGAQFLELLDHRFAQPSPAAQRAQQRDLGDPGPYYAAVVRVSLEDLVVELGGLTRFDHHRGGGQQE